MNSCNTHWQTVVERTSDVVLSDNRTKVVGRRADKLKFHGSSFLVADVTKILLTCHEESGTLKVRYDLNCVKSAVKPQPTNPQQVVRVGLVEF